MTRTFKKVFGIVVDVLMILVLLVSVLVIIMAQSSKKTGVANFLGVTMMTVQSDSMKPTMNEGDVIFGTVPKSGETYEVGDIITFSEVQNGMKFFNTHRIVKVEKVGDLTYYTTQGDKYNSEYNTNADETDPSKVDASRHLSADVVSVYHGARIGHVGKALDYIETQTGFFICVMIPVIILFVIQLIEFIKNLSDYNVEKAKSAVVELTEEQKKKAVEEYLAQNKTSSLTESAPEVTGTAEGKDSGDDKNQET